MFFLITSTGSDIYDPLLTTFKKYMSPPDTSEIRSKIRCFSYIYGGFDQSSPYTEIKTGLACDDLFSPRRPLPPRTQRRKLIAFLMVFPGNEIPWFYQFRHLHLRTSMQCTWGKTSSILLYYIGKVEDLL